MNIAILASFCQVSVNKLWNLITWWENVCEQLLPTNNTVRNVVEHNAIHVCTWSARDAKRGIILPSSSGSLVRVVAVRIGEQSKDLRLLNKFESRVICNHLGPSFDEVILADSSGSEGLVEDCPRK